MTETAARPWTLQELAAEVAARLSALGLDQQTSGRVSEVPSGRAIRYYTTHGLVDRPLGYRGRTALYGSRHLLQLLAIKRLQARGLSLVEIQQRLIGADDDRLRQEAGLDTEPSRPTPATGMASERHADFWTQEPAPPTSARVDPPSPAGHPSEHQLVPAVRLSEETFLLLLGGAERGIDEDDIRAIEIAAAPLLKLLTARRLVSQGGTQ